MEGCVVLFIYLDNMVQVTEARRQQSRTSAAALLRRLPTVSSLHRSILSAVSCHFPVSLWPAGFFRSTHLFSYLPTQPTPSRLSSAVTTMARETAAGRRLAATPWKQVLEGKWSAFAVRLPARRPLLRDPSDYPTGSSSARYAVWSAPDPTC